MSKKNILFVRHAESESNAGLPTFSSQTTALSLQGKAQAKNLAETFPLIPQLIVVSTYLRTQESAKPLISKLKNVKVETWDMIHEFTYLRREKNKKTTPQERKKYAIAYWEKQDPLHKDGPLEESFVDLLKRGERFIEKLKKQKEDNIVIFSHGQFLRSLKLIKELNKKVDTLTLSELIELMADFKKLDTTFPIKNLQILTSEELLN